MANSAKSKKKALLMIGLVVLLGALIALYYFMPTKKTDEGTTEGTDTATASPDTTITVDNIDGDSVTKLYMKNKDGEVTLIKDGDKWCFANDKSIPVISDSVDTMLTSIAPVTATKEISKGDDVSEYGLDNPSLIVKITLKDKTVYQYELGSQVPVEGGYYGLSQDGSKLYSISANFYSAFNQTVKGLTEQETVPTIDSNYITAIDVDNKSGDDFSARRVATEDRVDSFCKWNIYKPFANAVAGHQTNFTTFVEKFSSLTLKNMITYKTTNFKKYGLDQPKSTINVSYYTLKDGVEAPTATTTPDANGNSETVEVDQSDRDNHNFILYIGNKKGSNYYVRMEGSDGVYTMDATTIDTIIGVDAFEQMDPCIYATLATELKGYDFTIGNKTWKVKREESPTEKAEDGNPLNVWYINNKLVDSDKEEDFLTPYSKMYLLEFTGRVKSSVKPKSNKLVFTVVLHEKKKDVTIKYLPYDGENFYRVEKDGEAVFLTDKRGVDDMISAFKKIESTIK